MGRPRLVIAEDSSAVRRHLEALLAIEFEVIGVAEDGVEMLALVRAMTPDALVVDIAMPRMNGLDAVAMLRGEGNDTPVVFASVHTEPELIARVKLFGHCGYVVKERAVEELRAAIHEQLALPGEVSA